MSIITYQIPQGFTGITSTLDLARQYGFEYSVSVQGNDEDNKVQANIFNDNRSDAFFGYGGNDFLAASAFMSQIAIVSFDGGTGTDYFFATDPVDPSDLVFTRPTDLIISFSVRGQDGSILEVNVSELVEYLAFRNLDGSEYFILTEDIANDRLRTASFDEVFFRAYGQNSDWRLKDVDTYSLYLESIISAPQNILLTSATFEENIAPSTTVAILSTIDLNLADTFRYELVPGAGSTDNNVFTIIGDELKISTVPDFETKSSYSIRLRTTDAAGLSFEKSFILEVQDVAETPGPQAFSLNPSTMQLLYVAYYGRPGDVGGLQFWQSKVTESGFTYAPRLGDGLTETERPLYDRIVVDFGNSIESQQLYAGKTKQESADTVYQYCFGRDAEIDPITGENYWVGKLERNEITLSQLAAEVALGAQGPDLTFMNNRIEAANLFFNAMDTPAEQLGYSGPNDDALARNWLLQFGFTRATSAMADGIMETIVATI